jgi:Predicted membrane protein (DUF2306)
MQGWSAGRAHEWLEHRCWMLQSFALTVAPVTLSICGPLSAVLGLDLIAADRAIAELSWVPNAFLAELYLRRGMPLVLRRRQRSLE